MQERLLDSVLNALRFLRDGLVKVLSLLTEFVKDQDRVFHIYLGFLLQLLHSSYDLSSETSHFKLFILTHVKEHTK